MDATAVERVRKKYGIGDCPVVLFVGTVMPRKGVVELVRAFDQLVNERGRDIHLVLVGETGLDEAYVEKVESFISRDKLDNHVTMPGFVPGDDLPALYRLADVLAVPSLEEGFGMTAIEAMAAGTPVVGSRVGGLPQVIESGQTGLLTEPGDVDGLATAIEDVLTQLDRDDITDMVRQKAMKYSWESVATQFETVYEGIQNE
ncbi:glycosyltransferase family 4 protein [Halorubrum sp. AS12]|uniref:glycosyltransferase family 4 protein n=1 Tax=Halorubrum sp. AS12 TaxID=3409687 RepID=UPI003DA72CC4